MAVIVISYDITNDRRRNKVAKKLLDYGRRVQYSVFELIYDDVILKKVLIDLKRIIKEEEDSIRCYRVCKSCSSAVEIIGKVKEYDIAKDFIII